MAFQTIIYQIFHIITILREDLFLDISYCPQSFLYCFKGEIGSTANVHTISCQVILNIFQDFSKVFVLCFSLIFFMFCRCHQVFGIVSKREMAAHSSHNFPSSIFTSIYRKGRASFQEDKWRNCHRHISWTGLKLSPSRFLLFCFINTPTSINLHTFCPSSSYIGLYKAANCTLLKPHLGKPYNALSRQKENWKE